MWNCAGRTAELGTHTTTWTADPDNQIQELDETNNERTYEFTVETALSVDPVSPPTPIDGGSVTKKKVTLKVQVTSDGNPVKQATVTIYLDGVPVCSKASNKNGYVSCNVKVTQIGHDYTWYATATKPGYSPDDSPTWTFTRT